MAFMEWKAEYSVGIEKLDNQHKELVRMINDFHEAMKVGKAKEMTGPMLTRLISYTQDHFRTEESLFDLHHYPFALAHKTEHQKLVEEITVLLGEFNKGTPMIALRLGEFLGKWLVDHIVGSDRKYTAFLQSKGLK